MWQHLSVESTQEPVPPGGERARWSGVEAFYLHLRRVQSVERVVVSFIVMKREDGHVVMAAECRGNDCQHPLDASYAEHALAEETHSLGFMIHAVVTDFSSCKDSQKQAIEQIIAEKCTSLCFFFFGMSHIPIIITNFGVSMRPSGF